MADPYYSDLFREDPELLDRALASFDNAHPEVYGPEPDAAVTSEPTGPVDMSVQAPVEQPRGSLGQQQQALTEGSVDAANDAAQSFQREGDAKADASLRAAQVYGEQAQVADRYAAAAERKYNDHQDRAAYYRRMEDEDFERLKKETPRPGAMKNAFNVITGIIGAAAGGSTGDALGMLRQHVNREAEIDAQERGAAMQRIGVAQKIHDSILSDSANEFDASAKLVANQWLAASRQLEQISNESNVPAFREQALRLSIQAQEQARGILAHNVDAQIKQRAAQAAAMRPKWDNMTQGELEALQRAGVLPIEAAEKLAKLQKSQREAAGGDDGGNGRIIADPKIAGLQAIPGVTHTRESIAKAQGAKTMLDKVTRHLQEARRLATVDTSAYPYDNDRMRVESEYAGQRASALALISQLVEAGVLNEGDAQRFGAGLPEPDALWRNDMDAKSKKAVYDTMLDNFERNSRDGIRTLGFEVPGRPAGDTRVEDQAARFGAVPKAAPVPVASSGAGP